MSESKEKVLKVDSQASGLSVDDVQRAFEERQKTLVDFLNKETNIANRYEIKLRLEELNVAYNAVMSLVK